MYESAESSPTVYFSSMGKLAGDIVKNNKGVVFVGKSFIFGYFSTPVVDLKKMEEYFGCKVILKKGKKKKGGKKKKKGGE